MIKAKLVFGGGGGGGGGGLLVPQANFYCISNLGVTSTLYLGAIHRAVIKMIIISNVYLHLLQLFVIVN